MMHMKSNRSIRIALYLIVAFAAIFGVLHVEFISNYVTPYKYQLQFVNASVNQTLTDKHEHIIWIFNVDTREINTLPSKLTKFQFPFFTTALNGYYASLFNYRFVYLYQPTSKFCPLLQKKGKSNKTTYVCNRFDKNTTLAIQWIKVKGILYMLENIMNENDLGLYIDTDVTFSFEPRHFKSIQDYLNEKLPEMHPNQYFNTSKQLSKKIAFVNDSHSYWTKVSGKSEITTGRAINSGVIFFYNCETTRVFMNEWWISMSQVETPLEKKFKVSYETEWPYEQGKLTYMVATQIFKQHIAYMFRNQEFITHWGLTEIRNDAADYAFSTTMKLCQKGKFQFVGIYCENGTNYAMNDITTRQILQHLISTYVEQIQF